MTEQARQTIREALVDLIRIASSEGYDERADNALQALALLEAEPPQADASAEELATEIYGLLSDNEDAEAAALITAYGRAQLEKAAERLFALLGINIEGYIVHKCQPISGQTLYKTILGNE